MARLTRKNMKVFAENATNNGVFGSLQASDPVTTTDVETIQSLSAWGEGWDSATVTGEKLPPLEEFQGVQYVTTYQQAYLMQEGMPEWSASVTYYKGCLAKEVTSTGFRIYNSLTNNNTGNLLSDTSNWKKIMDSDDLYAFDNEVVHKTGTEQISGTKIFLSSITIKNSENFSAQFGANRVEFKPISTAGNGGYVDFHFNGAASNTSRIIEEGSGYLRFEVRNPNDSSQITSMYFGYKDGAVLMRGVTPTTTTSTASVDVATTGWVNSVGNNVVHLTGSETISGIKNFSTSPTVPTPSSSDNSSKAANTAFVTNVVDLIYPVGSIYIGTQSTCPLASIIPNSIWELVAKDKALWTGDGTNANTTIEAGLPNHTHGTGRQAGDNKGSHIWNSLNEDYVLGSHPGGIYWNGSGTGGTPDAITAGASMNNSLGWAYTEETSLAKTDNLSSDGVWGNSTTVQPPAYVVNVWRRVA